MARPRIIIADTDVSYILPLQQKFIEEYFEKIDLEVISDPDYYEQLFGSPQKVDVLIVSEELYNTSIHRHDIGIVFLMTEQYEERQSDNPKVVPIYKYTNIKDIIHLIVGRSSELKSGLADGGKTTKIVLVYSACGGVGKTAVALGVSACLNAEFKKVLYMNAEHLQTFQVALSNISPIMSSDVYTKLANVPDDVYSEVKHFIRNEGFSYIPPFKAALISLGIPYYVYERIALSAKKTQEYDYIMIDADSCFDEEKTRLMDIADKVIVVTKQNKASAYASKMLVSNINEVNSDKYLFVCNDFVEDDTNYLISPDVISSFNVSDYIGHIPYHEQLAVRDLVKEKDLQKVAFLLL